MKKLPLLVLLLGLCVLARGQTLEPTVLSTAGTDAGTANAQLSWTVGETMIESYSAGSNVLTQGFHQTNLVIIGREEPMPEFQVDVFPVPFQDQLNIRIGEHLQSVEVSIYDVRAKRVLPAWELSGNGTHNLDVTDISAGMYFLNVQHPDGTLIQSFKIQKIH